MKEFVVGSPYTTETTITSSDSWLIVACDGVRSLSLSPPFLFEFELILEERVVMGCVFG